ncbi:LOW QUALITY PROTEIN: hypothetical protein YC2023_050362 [Brassica napus]
MATISDLSCDLKRYSEGSYSFSRSGEINLQKMEHFIQISAFMQSTNKSAVCRVHDKEFKAVIFMAEKRFEYRYATEDELEEMKQREFSGLMFTYVSYIKYPRVRNIDDPWVTVTRLNPRGRVQGSSELDDPLQPSTFGNLSAAEDLVGVGLVVDFTDFGEEAVVHVEDEPVIGEFHQDPDPDSSGDDDSETDYH